PSALHATSVSVVPVTVAWNVVVSPTCRDTDVGSIDTRTVGSGWRAVTVAVTVDDLVRSALLVAITWSVSAAAGAVRRADATTARPTAACRHATSPLHIPRARRRPADAVRPPTR